MSAKNDELARIPESSGPVRRVGACYVYIVTDATQFNL
jgi:hypothetical protein